MFKIATVVIAISTGFGLVQSSSSLGYGQWELESETGWSTGAADLGGNLFGAQNAAPVDINFPVDDYSSEYFTRVRTRSGAIKTSSMHNLPIDNSRSGFGMRCGQWFNAAVEAGWPYDRIKVLLTELVWNESRCLAGVKSRTNDYGLAQINRHAHRNLIPNLGLTFEDLYDPVTNLSVALVIANMSESYDWKWCDPWKYSGSYC